MRARITSGLIITAIALTLPLVPVGATCGGGGGGGDGGTAGQKTYSVPWQRLKEGDPLPKGTLMVYWFPASDAQFDASTLRSSRLLSLYGARCLALVALDPASSTAQKFAADGKAPAVVLAAPDDTVIGKVEAIQEVTVEQVELIVDTEMKKREGALLAQLESGKNKAKSGDKDGAITDLKAVVEQKCLFPKPAKEAVKELKKLGVSDISATAIPNPTNLDPAFTAKIQLIMRDGLRAENDAQYFKAEKLYKEAHRLDPADPVPLRYLAELYRHHIGDWDTAAVIFNQILAMQSDPLSRAVALHGLGKMTIHNGQFKKGLALMEQSVQLFPLAMAYRNLAVYWNSEGDSAKCDQYTRLALAADAHDPFNAVFVAVFLAGNGHTDEALKVAKDHEDLMPASYNLAAIYAQSGQKDKALSLLKRHFYEYERYKSVRSKEMMEARVDRVFDSLMKDPAFLTLTADADGKLPMRDGSSAPMNRN